MVTKEKELNVIFDEYQRMYYYKKQRAKSICKIKWKKKIKQVLTIIK